MAYPKNFKCMECKTPVVRDKTRCRPCSKKGDLNPQWSFVDPSYKGLHAWVRRNKPIPKYCENCKEEKRLDAANISQEYFRDLDDWEYLCRKCHMVKDERLAIFINWNKTTDKKKSHCKYGHLMATSARVSILPNGKTTRSCRPCHAEYERNRRAKLKEEAYGRN